MKRLSIFLILSLAILQAGDMEEMRKYYADSYEVVNIRSNDTLNVRLGKNSNTQRVGELAYNARKIKVLYCERNRNGSKWCKIRHNSYGNRIRGWVSARYIQPSYRYRRRDRHDTPYYQPRNRYHVVGISRYDTLNVRRDAGTEFRIIGELRYNAKGLRVIRCKQSYSDGKWCKVSHPSIPNGWVSTNYIQSSRR